MAVPSTMATTPNHSRAPLARCAKRSARRYGMYPATVPGTTIVNRIVFRIGIRERGMTWKLITTEGTKFHEGSPFNNRFSSCDLVSFAVYWLFDSRHNLTVKLMLAEENPDAADLPEWSPAVSGTSFGDIPSTFGPQKRQADALRRYSNHQERATMAVGAKIAKTADRKKVMDTTKSTDCPKCGKPTRIVKRVKDRERGVPGGIYISCSACEFFEKL